MIRIAVPNKGRLATPSLELLERAGFDLDGRTNRALQANIGHGFAALFVRARDIPEFVADGAADVGITGGDLVAEADRPVERLLDLGFGRCRLAVAAREEGDVHCLEDIAPHVRVATSFPTITARFFAERGCPVDVVPVSGAAEIVPHLGVADVIVDLVSTGSTLKVNGLKEVATVLDSEALVIGRPDVPADDERSRSIGVLTAALESVLRARDKRYLMANVPRESLDEVRRILPGLNGPTVVDVLDGDGHLAAHAVVDRRDVYGVIADLKGIGAEGILVSKIERLMP